MNTEITVALIGFFGGFLGALAGIPLLAYRIGQLEKKVDKHNCVIERTYKLESRMDYVEKELGELS